MADLAIPFPEMFRMATVVDTVAKCKVNNK